MYTRTSASTHAAVTSGLRFRSVTKRPHCAHRTSPRSFPIFSPAVGERFAAAIFRALTSWNVRLNASLNPSRASSTRNSSTSSTLTQGR